MQQMQYSLNGAHATTSKIQHQYANAPTLPPHHSSQAASQSYLHQAHLGMSASTGDAYNVVAGPQSYSQIQASLPSTSPTQTAPVYDNNRQTALHAYRAEIMQAAQRRDIARLKIMVSTMVNHNRLSAAELNSCLVLHHVAWTSELNDIAELLLSLGCDPYYPDINGDTVFHYTVRGCNLSFLKALVKIYGLCVLEVLNNNHFNLFLTASAEAHDEKAYVILNIVEWLYLNGVSIESQDANGITGLMWACRRASLSLVQWFLSRGANLAHRDHNGRTVLQMACLSGHEDTVRTVCEVGAVFLLHCESNDDPESNTALKLCWNKGHFFLGLSLRQWYFQKKVFGFMRIFKNTYAWYYWLLTGYNFIVYLAISYALVNENTSYYYTCATLGGIIFFSQVNWILAFASDPGYVKSKIIYDQSHRCSPSFRHDLKQQPVITYRKTSASYKLQTLERLSCKVGADITNLNRHHGNQARFEEPLPVTTEKEYEFCVMRKQELREGMLELMEAVGVERRKECLEAYAVMVLDGSPRSICLTCRIIKPFRTHHCGDCGHCIHRFDHHCVWVDNCIGQGNQRSFLMFLTSLTISILYFWVLIAIYYKTFLVERIGAFWSVFKEPLFYLALCTALFNLLWAGFVGYLCGRTCKSMCTNITFYEFWKKPNHISKRFNGNIHHWFWDTADLNFKRVLRNIYSYFSGDNRWDAEDYPSCAIKEPTQFNGAEVTDNLAQLTPMLK